MISIGLSWELQQLLGSRLLFPSLLPATPYTKVHPGLLLGKSGHSTFSVKGGLYCFRTRNRVGSQLIYEIYLATLGGLDFLCFQEAVSLFGGLGHLLGP